MSEWISGMVDLNKKCSATIGELRSVMLQRLRWVEHQFTQLHSVTAENVVDTMRQGAAKLCAQQETEKNEPITNADRIRAMSDKELAIEIMCPYEIEPELCSTKNCIDCCLDWLQQPAEEVTP